MKIRILFHDGKKKIKEERKTAKDYTELWHIDQSARDEAQRLGCRYQLAIVA